MACSAMVADTKGQAAAGTPVNASSRAAQGRRRIPPRVLADQRKASGSRPRFVSAFQAAWKSAADRTRARAETDIRDSVGGCSRSDNPSEMFLDSRENHLYCEIGRASCRERV